MSTVTEWVALSNPNGGVNLPDMNKLNGRRAKCVHPDIGTLHGTLVRNFKDSANINDPITWGTGDIKDPWNAALVCAWYGRNGWVLYVKGKDVLTAPEPHKASELAIGTEFLGENSNGVRQPWAVVLAPNGAPTLVELLSYGFPNRPSLDSIKVVSIFSGGVSSNPS